LSSVEEAIAPRDHPGTVPVVAIDFIAKHGIGPSAEATREACRAFERMSSDLEAASEEMIAGCAPSVRAVLKAASSRGFHPALFRWACHEAGVPDGDGVLRRMLEGAPLVGDLPIDPEAVPKVVRVATVSRAELLGMGEDLAARLAAKARPHFVPEFGDGDARQIWDATMDEVAKGRISQPVRWSEADQSSVVCRRFGVWQLASSGKMKLRVIDDFAENMVNDATSVGKRIRMGSLADLGLCEAFPRCAPWYSVAPHQGGFQVCLLSRSGGA